MDVVMSISCFDSSGGTGIQADLMTFQQMGVYGTCAVTTLAAQNTLGYQGLYPVTAEFVIHQIETIMRDFQVCAVKIGLLYREDIIEAVAKTLQSYRIPIILDPIIRTDGGITILNEAEIKAYCDYLIPISNVVIMTVPAVSAFTNIPIFDENDVDKAARAMFKLGAQAVIVKGSKISRDKAVDTVYTLTELSKLSAERIQTIHNFGSSCSYSAALTVGIGKGQTVVEAATEAKRYVTTAMKYPLNIGLGMGPLNHFIYEQEKDNTIIEKLPNK